MGRAIVRDLFDSNPESRILIADYNLDAVAIDTGVPPSVVAQMVAGGEISERGVHAPETCVSPERFFQAIAGRGMRVRVARDEPLAG